MYHLFIQDQDDWRVAVFEGHPLGVSLAVSSLPLKEKVLPVLAASKVVSVSDAPGTLIIPESGTNMHTFRILVGRQKQLIDEYTKTIQQESIPPLSN